MIRDEQYAIQEWYCTIEKDSCYNEAKCSACDLADEWIKVDNDDDLSDSRKTMKEDMESR